MRWLLLVVAGLAVLGYAGIQVVNRVTLSHYGDPSTQEGYARRYVDSHLRLTLDRKESQRLQRGQLVLRGRLRNGGDRTLRDVLVWARYATDPGAPQTQTTLHLGPFAPGEERTFDQRVAVVPLALDIPLDRLELHSDLTVERVELGPTPGSTASRP